MRRCALPRLPVTYWIRPWEERLQMRQELVPLAGFELATFALRMRCSTN